MALCISGPTLLLRNFKQRIRAEEVTCKKRESVLSVEDVMWRTEMLVKGLNIMQLSMHPIH